MRISDWSSDVCSSDLIAGDELYPLEAGIRAEQTLIDSGRRRGEKLRQAARVDGAALRVVDRPDFIAPQSARQDLDVPLTERVVAAAEENIDLKSDVSGKSVPSGVDPSGRSMINNKNK